MLWIGTAGHGLDALEPKTGTFTHYKSDIKNRRSLSDNRVQSIYQDRSSALWIGTRDGLNRLDSVHGTFEHYKYDPGITSSLSGKDIRSLFQDQSGVLWVGALDGGLSKFNPRQELFAHWANEPGNANNVSRFPVSIKLVQAVTRSEPKRTGSVF